MRGSGKQRGSGSWRGCWTAWRHFLGKKRGRWQTIRGERDKEGDRVGEAVVQGEEEAFGERLGDPEMEGDRVTLGDFDGEAVAEGEREGDAAVGDTERVTLGEVDRDTEGVDEAETLVDLESVTPPDPVRVEHGEEEGEKVALGERVGESGEGVTEREALGERVGEAGEREGREEREGDREGVGVEPPTLKEGRLLPVMVKEVEEDLDKETVKEKEPVGEGGGEGEAGAVGVMAVEADWEGMREGVRGGELEGLALSVGQ